MAQRPEPRCRAHRSGATHCHRYMSNNASVMAAMAFLLLLALRDLRAVDLQPYDPYARGLLAGRRNRQSSAHPFGTDEFGRDLLMRTALGGRVFIAIGFAATFVIMSIGIDLRRNRGLPRRHTWTTR